MTPAEIRLAHFDTANGCWEWSRAKTKQGYGKVWFQGKTWTTHRLMYTLHKGPIPEGLQIDHLCRNTSCGNPSHLEAVTASENTLRSSSSHNLNGICRNGLHDVTDPGSIVYVRGKRKCKKCYRNSQNKYMRSWYAQNSERVLEKHRAKRANKKLNTERTD